ncbi:EVE domain-containing protein [Terriglobus aquaticus]|uniref:EVE domain-containing protein n=1 Tax=Terriglobus aquaticus TaxID=940139 RepID=A0ABW9KID6_9BACT|nr:EVE domain-containing protein [Terriglobus aquaticus]
MPYLLKSEPDKYSFDDLLRDGETTWDGIKNPQALITLRNMKRGEHCVIYHSNIGKEAVGTATVVSVDSSDTKNPIVRLKAGKRLKQPKSLAMLREAPVFQDSLLFRQFRLSVVPLDDAQYEWLLHAEANVPPSATKKAAAKSSTGKKPEPAASKTAAKKSAPKKSAVKGKKA